MDNFFAKLKEFLINTKQTINKDLDIVGYYETLLQHKEELKEIIKDCLNANYYEFVYQEDDTNGYTQGKILICLYDEENYWPEASYNYHYVIELLYDERLWGYCMCDPDKEGYNPKYKCCGISCDWVSPAVSVIKVESLAGFSFKGQQRDMWALEEKWQDILREHEVEKLKKEIKQLDSYIFKYEKDREEKLRQLEELTKKE